MYWIAWSVVGVWLRLCYRFRVVGRENVPAEGGVILASNHVSFFDPMVVGCAHRRKTVFVARGSLKKSLVYSLVTKGIDIVSIDPAKGDRESIRTVAEKLDEGACCALFPEGTRSDDGEVKELKRGFAMFAKRASVPVVPIWIEGTYDAWPRRRRLPKPFGRIEVRFGPPIRVDDPKSAADTLRAALDRLAGRATAPPVDRGHERTKVGAVPSDEGIAAGRPTAQGCGAATEGASAVDARPIT